MRKLLMFALSVLALCQLRAQLGPTAFTLTEPGVGTITLETYNRMEGKLAVFEASARNDTGKPIKRAYFCVHPINVKYGCSFTFGNDAGIWQPGATITQSLRVPVVHGFSKHAVSILKLSVVSKLDPVHKLFVGEIDGANGAMSADQLKALISNSVRFQLTEDRSLADAVLVGRSETRQGGSRSASVASEFGSVGPFFGGAIEASSSRVGSQTELLVTENLVFRLVLPLPGGGTLWAWDDTKPCGSARSKAECAIGYLVAEATK